MQTAATDHAGRNPPVVVSSSEAVKVTSPHLSAGAPRRFARRPLLDARRWCTDSALCPPPPEGHISRGPLFVAAPVAGSMALASHDAPNAAGSPE